MRGLVVIVISYGILISGVCFAKREAGVRVTRSSETTSGASITLHVQTEDAKHSFVLNKAGEL